MTEPAVPAEPAAPYRILFVTSSGGHLAQLLQLRDWWSRHERTWVTFDKPDAVSSLAGEHVRYAFHPTTRHVGNLARNALLAASVINNVKPDLVMSTGAGVALPFFAFARSRGIPTIYLEVYDRLDSTTLTGRLCRPFTSEFLVQWPEQQPLYKDSTVVGVVL